MPFKQMQIFKSMPDVTTRILDGAVSERRSIYIENLTFINKATEIKFLCILLLIISSDWGIIFVFFIQVQKV